MIVSNFLYWAGIMIIEGSSKSPHGGKTENGG